MILINKIKKKNKQCNQKKKKIWPIIKKIKKLGDMHKIFLIYSMMNNEK